MAKADQFGLWLQSAATLDALLCMDQELPVFLELESAIKTHRHNHECLNRGPNRMKNWEIIADNLSKAGWSWGYVSAVDPRGERSGLQTRIATVESVSLYVRMKSYRPFSIARIRVRLARSY